MDSWSLEDSILAQLAQLAWGPETNSSLLVNRSSQKERSLPTPPTFVGCELLVGRVIAASFLIQPTHFSEVECLRLLDPSTHWGPCAMSWLGWSPTFHAWAKQAQGWTNRPIHLPTSQMFEKHWFRPAKEINLVLPRIFFVPKLWVTPFSLISLRDEEPCLQRSELFPSMHIRCFKRR